MALNLVIDVLIEKLYEDTETYRRELRVKMEAETGMVHL